MWQVLLRIAIGVLLIIHGVAHVEITRVWGARESATSWLIGEADRLGTVLSTVALVGFALSGLALFVGFGAWRPLAVGAACVSLVTMSLFWDWKLAFGVVVNLAVLVALLWARWRGHDLVVS
jgi:hypothetical protein